MILRRQLLGTPYPMEILCTTIIFFNSLMCNVLGCQFIYFLHFTGCRNPEYQIVTVLHLQGRCTNVVQDLAIIIIRMLKMESTERTLTRVLYCNF